MAKISFLLFGNLHAPGVHGTVGSGGQEAGSFSFQSLQYNFVGRDGEAEVKKQNFFC